MQGLCSELAKEPGQLEWGSCTHQVRTDEIGDGPRGQTEGEASDLPGAVRISPVQKCPYSLQRRGAFAVKLSRRRERRGQLWVRKSSGREGAG